MGKKKTQVHIFRDMDKVLLILTLILIVFGTLNIVTASSREAVLNTNSNMFYYFFRHMIILGGSFIATLFILNVPTSKYKKLFPFIYIIVIVLNGYLVLKGVATRGANNWIPLPFFKLQPSEIAKPVLIVVTALLFEKFNKKLLNPYEKKDMIIWTILGMGLIIPILVFLQKDLGTATILIMIFAVMFIFSPITTNDKFKAGFVSIIIILAMLLVRFLITGYILSGAQSSRLSNFVNPCANYESSGYQVCNAFIAINNGGLFGVGLGKSTQKYSYIPEPHTDMVFAIIAEENGVIVCAIILLIYVAILYRILKISLESKKLRNRYICVGAAVYIFLHIFINLGGLFGLIPLTGVPLPFLSYGGSFTLSLISTLAIIQRINIENKNEKIKV